MAEIRAFPALRYAEGIDLAAVTCPPYDVLSPAERQALIDRSPHATARLILPEGEGDARYRNAADLLTRWQSEGVLQTDPARAFYVTRTTFTEPGAEMPTDRLGLIGLLRLHEYADRVVLPHERTLDKPKADRLSLLRATNANVESIMALVEDKPGTLYDLLKRAVQGAPTAAFDGDDRQRHELYAVTDSEAVAKIAAAVAPEAAYIADGHHRYETSLAFARERGVLGTDDPAAFILTTFSSMYDPGLVVLPTHRLVRGTPADLLHTVFTKLEPVFDIREADLEDLEGRLRLSVINQPVIGLCLGKRDLYQLTLRDVTALESLLPASVHASLRQLEPVLLLHLILGPAFGLQPDEVATTDRLAYTRDAAEAVRRVQGGEFDAAFLLGRPAVSVIKDVSLAGEVMPQKSTFFYPKLVSGLVMRSL